MHPFRARQARLLLLVPLLAVGCSSTSEADEQKLESNTRITVCIGTSAQHGVGDDVHLEVVSDETVLTGAIFPVPGEVVLKVPASAPEPRLLLDGRELASSPRGGGWGLSQGDGCPVASAP